ncbi:MAG: HAD-IC family P-type ATPase [Clostridia bacterium]|nr:HAD-IC family P-type ATPase [Clostridia bacterium]
MKNEPIELKRDDTAPADLKYTMPEGLTDAEVKERLANGKGNKMTAEAGKSFLRIVREHSLTLFNLLNFGMAAMLASVGAYRNMLFLGVVISNALIGTVQEVRAMRAIRKMKLKSEAPVTALRNGRETSVPPEALVEGDLVILRQGEQVPADAVVLSGFASANESLVTGESRPIPKHAGDCLLSGAFVSAGHVTAQLYRVGDESYISRLQKSASRLKHPVSQLLTDMRKLVRVASMLMLPIAALLFAKQYFYLKQPLEETIPRVVASMVGMLPEGLILLTSMALTAGVVRLGRKGTLINHLYGIESLARVDMLCLDKTGTLTSGEMTLDRLETDQASESETASAFSRFLGAQEDTSPTLRALRDAFPPASEKPTATLAFSSERKCSGAAFADGRVLILGAPSMILGDAFTDERKSRVQAFAEEGLRVLCLAEANRLWTETALPPISRVLGFALIRDRLRSNVRETLAYFKEQGVGLRVISGDDPVTVSRIALSAGIEGAERYADVSGLNANTPMDEIRALVRDTIVFGRVSPEGKCLLIEALREEGHTVAMTGDGVNDIPAMQRSDCAIAIGSGSDAARKTAQVILLNDDFSSLPGVVNEGRRVINNISRSATLFLVKTLYSFALSVLILFIRASYPFRPVQLTLLSSLTIGIPSFILAFEPDETRVSGHFLKKVILRAIPGGLAVTICAFVCASLEKFWNADVCSSIATVSAGCCGLCVLLLLCLPPTRLRAAVFSLCAAALVLVFVFFGKLVYLVPLNHEQGLVLAGLCAFSVLLITLSTRAVKRRVS